MEKDLDKQELFYAYLDGKHTAMLDKNTAENFLYLYSVRHASSKQAAYKFIEGYRDMVQGTNQTFR
jgi:hypothetical protein